MQRNMHNSFEYIMFMIVINTEAQNKEKQNPWSIYKN